MIAAVLLPLLQLAATAPQPELPQPAEENVPACTPPSEGAAPQEEAEQGETHVLPGTGFAFVIPGEEAPVLAEPLPPCEPEPVRPRDLDIFGFHALPVANGPIAARWRAGELLELGDPDAPAPDVASLTWGLGQALTGGADPLDLVNRRVNGEFRYVEDPGGDRWASARETIARRAGDCEDLAILKLALLARAGVESDRLFLVVVRDTARQRDHAVAAVRWENRLWVLDSRLDRVQPAERVLDYVPLQSFSGRWAWTYGYREGTSAGRAARTIAAVPVSGR